MDARWTTASLSPTGLAPFKPPGQMLFKESPLPTACRPATCKGPEGVVGGGGSSPGEGQGTFGEGSTQGLLAVTCLWDGV